MKNRTKSTTPKQPLFKLSGKNFHPKKTFFLFLIAGISLSFQISAQPSGGPYGPVCSNYEIPKNAGHIYIVSPDGQPGKPGTLQEPTTLEEAIKKAVTGDAIILRGGTYRTGNLIFNQGITLQPYADEKPVMKGTFEANEWKDIHNGLWSTSWKTLFPSKPDSWWRKERSGKITPLHLFNNDMVFIDGKFLQSAGWLGEVDSDHYFIDYDAQTIYIGTDPTNHQVEITAFNGALIRTIKECNEKKSDGKGPVIKGITFTQYAYRALEIEGKEPEGLSPESEHGKDVVGTLIENCTISFCSRVAGYLRGDKMTIRNCKVSDTSTEGIYIIASNDVLLEKNIFTRNNIEKIDGYFPSGVKIFNQCYRCTCRDNLVIDQINSNGIWYDVGNVDGRFINNWVENVKSADYPGLPKEKWPDQNGFFFEISKGVICAGNVFVNCDHGMMILNSCDAQVYQNTFVNSTACFERNGRSAVGDHFGWHPSTGPDVGQREGHVFVNNLLYKDTDSDQPFVFVGQPAPMCDQLKTSTLKEFDHNAYVEISEAAPSVLIDWAPVASTDCQLKTKTLAELQIYYPQFNKNSTVMNNEPCFRSVDLMRFEPIKGFRGEKLATSLPPQVSTLLGI
ncbi:MAG TPA: right-handed parallel beta-helix repeat-containing protein, partial [Prolixibacteraceae bacterium]|nr:right-handed parallel beta-helix repeat-containing protein [Prolixibacteraceae bacterium]